MRPMQKTSTHLNKTDLSQPQKQSKDQLKMQPSNATLQKILQFAASHRALKIQENQYVELFLN